MLINLKSGGNGNLGNHLSTVCPCYVTGHPVCSFWGTRWNSKWFTQLFYPPPPFRPCLLHLGVRRQSMSWGFTDCSFNSSQNDMTYKQIQGNWIAHMCRFKTRQSNSHFKSYLHLMHGPKWKETSQQERCEEEWKEGGMEKGRKWCKQYGRKEKS